MVVASIKANVGLINFSLSKKNEKCGQISDPMVVPHKPK
jgi:hypothetical protein